MQNVLNALALTRKNGANLLGNDPSKYLDITKKPRLVVGMMRNDLRSAGFGARFHQTGAVVIGNFLLVSYSSSARMVKNLGSTP